MLGDIDYPVRCRIMIGMVNLMVWRLVISLVVVHDVEFSISMFRLSVEKSKTKSPSFVETANQQVDGDA